MFVCCNSLWRTTMSAITTCSFGINVTLCELHLTIACVTTQLRSPLICLSALVVAWLCLAEPLFFLIILSISSEETRSYSRLLLWGSWPRYKEDSRWGFCSFLQLTELPWLHRLGAQILGLARLSLTHLSSAVNFSGFSCISVYLSLWCLANLKDTIWLMSNL